MDLKEIGRKCVDWINLAQDMACDGLLWKGNEQAI
jgi:hypothetical protein